jgi:carboxyl-terminal processing protease
MNLKVIKIGTLPTLLLLMLLLASLAPAQVSERDRIKIFEKVWDTVNRKYYDPNFNGVNWSATRESYRPQIVAAKDDTEFYALVKQMVGELGDAHTSFRTPLEAQRAKLKQTVGVGLWLGEVEGKSVIFGVTPDSEAAKAGLVPGMILTAVDGRDVREILSEMRSKIKSSTANAVNRLAYARLLGGEVDSSVKLDLLDLEGREKQVTLARRVQTSTNSELISRRLPSNIGYVRFDEFLSKHLKPYKNALIELKDTKGLIIDLRFNRGGSTLALEEMAERLIAEKVSFGRAKTRTGKMPKFLGISLIPKEMFVGDDDMHIYSAPVVVLISRYSASAAEYFAVGMQESGRAKTVGETSCGCLLGITGKTKIEGGELYLSRIDFISAQGKRIEGVGVTPDVAIAPSIGDVKAGFTLAIAEAEKMLTGLPNL